MDIATLTKTAKGSCLPRFGTSLTRAASGVGLCRLDGTTGAAAGDLRNNGALILQYDERLLNILGFAIMLDRAADSVSDAKLEELNSEG